MGNPAAERDYEAFFSAENERLQRFATMLVGDPHAGAELAQEALARLYARWTKVQGTPGAYARQTVVNLVRSRHRSRKLRMLKPVPAWADGSRPTPAEAERVPESLDMFEALGTLSPIRRASIVLRFYEDMSEREIAELLDRPLGTVKSDIYRALRQLRSSLQEVGATGGER